MKKIAYIICGLILVQACSNTDDSGNNGANVNGKDDPVPVLLVFPQQDILCNEGLNPTPTESTVFFEWQPNNNALGYTLYLENLDTNTIAQYEAEAEDFIFPVTIARATPFRWRVDYNLDGEIKQSEVWNFYNAGPGLQTYAPFPAEIIAPTMAQNIPSTSAITLEWNGTDVDNDIVGYDVYFGTENPPNLDSADITANQISLPVNLDTIYFWIVVTKDSQGNSSQSGLFQFKVL